MKRRTFLLWVLTVLTPLAPSAFAGAARLDVPVVRQSEGRLCGPAAVEMVYRFWGESDVDQFEIASQIADGYSSEARFRGSGFLASHDPNEYPGTPAYVLRKFLASRASTEKYSLRDVPSSPEDLDAEFDKALSWIKGQLDRGIPVITHQYWSHERSTGHYRVITGYSDADEVVFLNDPKLGRITQSFAEFKRKGLFEGRWMPYYSLAFNTEKASGSF